MIRRPLLGRENSGLLSKVVSLLRVPVYKAKANGVHTCAVMYIEFNIRFIVK